MMGQRDRLNGSRLVWKSAFLCWPSQCGRQLGLAAAAHVRKKARGPAGLRAIAACLPRRLYTAAQRAIGLITAAPKSSAAAQWRVLVPSSVPRVVGRCHHANSSLPVCDEAHSCDDRHVVEAIASVMDVKKSEGDLLLHPNGGCANRLAALSPFLTSMNVLERCTEPKGAPCSFPERSELRLPPPLSERPG
jgi:hypothetical protein